ncbi:hypothetical protein LCGC14_1653510 [marine sediment metagenome]|uniref:DNA methylase N-4/N-6 domain-containing protein n=1 Tax=marine sediment metagenome TaxID=412755 RepID=A0A0F9IIR3_9ZZZZ
MITVDTVTRGDSFKLLETMDDKSVDLIITDPPYNFDFAKRFTLQNHFERICKGCILVFSPPENPWIFPADQYLFWVKPISTKNTSKKYSRFVEMVFVYGNGYWNPNRHWSQYTNIFNDLVEEKDHPYKKPSSLIERLILNHSKPGHIILDPFVGSGTTCVIAKALKRSYIGIEINEEFYNLSMKRLGEYGFYTI